MTDELVFYTNPMSRGRIVRWMLEEIGHPYRTELLDFGTTMKAPSYLCINPMGKVPTIRHGVTVVTEVAAICAYLADAFPRAGLFTSEQAEALAEALGEASQGDLATKTDLAGVRTEIAGLKTELKTELAGVGTEIAEFRTELKSEIAGARGELRSEIAGVGTEIAELRTELKTEIDSVRAELKADEAWLRTELKTEIAETRKDLLKWIIGAIGFQTVVILGALISIFIIFAK
jgi:glutathione S-transferase